MKKICYFLRLALVLTLCLCWTASWALAAEVIKNFSSTVTVRKDGSMHVKEMITFSAEGDQIRRGLYRDFPLGYSGPASYSGQVPFNIVSVKLDGKPFHSVSTERHGNMLRILMRNDELLSHAQHTFALEYETSLHLRFYEGYGELNWNVTGLWSFEILAFSCRIILPEGVPAQQTAAWMGMAGSRASEGITISKPAPNQALFVSNEYAAALLPGEEFTVAVSFPPGTIADPTAPLVTEQKASEAASEEMRAQDEARTAALAQEAKDKGFLSELMFYYPYLPSQAGLVSLVFFYFFLTWRRVGKDPAKDSVIARFYPPEAQYMGKGAGKLSGYMSPMAVEYLRRNLHSSGRGLAAIFISLAGKRLCTISKADEGDYVVQAKPLPPGGVKDFSPEEEIVYNRLIQATTNEALILSPKQEILRSIFTSAASNLRSNYGRAWSQNSLAVMLGWFVVLPLALTISFASRDASSFFTEYPDLPSWLILFIACLLFCALAVLPQTMLRLTGNWFAFAVSAIFPLSLVAAAYSEDFFDDPDWILPAIMLIVAYVFSLIMKAPSSPCRQALDKIEGLALYMRAAEKDRLEMFNKEDNCPQDTPEVFKRLLPYALVLGLEKTWCNRFASQIAAGLLRDSGIDEELVSTNAGWSLFAQGLASATVASAAQQSSSSSSASAFGGGGGGGSGSGSGGGGGGGL